MSWHHIAIGYVAYLVGVSLSRPEFAGARARLAALAAVVAALTAADLVFSPGRAWSWVILPSLMLLAGYRMSGLLFVRVDSGAENWLRRSDERALWRTGILPAYQRAPQIVIEYFELSYFLVYATIPAGAIVLLASGQAATVHRYWLVVLLAEFLCYGVLPWVQTRPPMLLEEPGAAPASTMRRVNQAIAARGSIHANTIPSGHAAGAFACALAVGDALPVAGAIFLFLAISISAASVAGRYHYLIDSVLGFIVAMLVWIAV